MPVTVRSWPVIGPTLNIPAAPAASLPVEPAGTPKEATQTFIEGLPYTQAERDRILSMAQGSVRGWDRAFLFRYDGTVRALEAQCAALTSEVSALREAVTRAEEEAERWRLSAFAPLGDNHHNAAACPYCTPRAARREGV